LSIGRILAETAPLYLTSGLSSSSSIALAQPGQTLTTRIYAQIYTSNVNQGTNVMYECALDTMILVFLIIFVVHVIIPQYYQYKQRRLAQRHGQSIDTSSSKINKAGRK
jgi:phosphate transport system permease protein